MTKALTYVEIDVPAFVPTVVRLALDTDFSDTNSDGSAHTWTAHGDAVLEGSAPFGVGLLKVSGAGWLDTPDSADYSFGASDFSIEFWFWNNTAIGTERNFCGQRTGVGGANTTRSFNIDIQPSGVISAKIFSGSTQFDVNGTTTFGVSTVYHHVSFTRQGDVLSLYVDGQLEAQRSDLAGASVNNVTGTLAIGQDGDDTTLRYNGWIDEFTIHRYARRDGSFIPTPSRYPFEGVGGIPIAQTSPATLRFAIDTRSLPIDIDAIPSLLEVKIDPATVSLGQDLGTRATVTCRFRDHRHEFDAEGFQSGTFWGKFRARYGLRLIGNALRVITGSVGQALANMETRHFVIESSTGPSTKGEYQIIAKDILKYADGDRSQAPVLSQGFLVADITSGATSATLSPSGIGSSYPASGKVAISGNEVCTFTRSGDVLTLTRAQNNTAAQAHSAQDRVQLVLEYASANPATIIRDLFVTYASVPSSYIDLTAWQNEISTYLNTVYSAVITEPTSVADLISELIEQVGLVVWWDSINEQIKLQVLRPIPSSADTFDADNILAGTLEVTEQPEKRLSQVYTYFAKINPTVEADQVNNYRSTSFVKNATAEAAYGSPVIKKIFSRWIPSGGRSIADSIGNVLLARFSDPPRRLAFSVLRGSVVAPILGVGYQIGGWTIQDILGIRRYVPAQITQLNPRADVFEIEAEEISPTSFAVASPSDHTIIIDSNLLNVNLRTMHDSIYGTPVAGNNVTCTINAGIIVGSTVAGTTGYAFDVGSWPAGVTIILIVKGRIQGKGGAGGGSAPQAAGGRGGTALRTTVAILLDVSAGAIWGGGGGGGIGGEQLAGVGGSGGGGGGAGTQVGAGGTGLSGGNATGSNGQSGTATTGGNGGARGGVGYGGTGGNGGGPGLAGAAGGTDTLVSPQYPGGAGGLAGRSIDGIANVTYVSGSPAGGDIRGPQV